GEEAWENKLAALRSYQRATGHLAPRQDALWGEDDAMVPIGQHMANLRRKGGLGKDPTRAAERAKQLAEIDPDWNCPWPLDWQRHHRVLADLVDADGVLPAIEPGVQFEGDDIGRWLQRQKNPGTWAQLLPEQQERLSQLGVTPVEAPSPAPAAKGATKGQGKAQQAFQRGLTALTQYLVREGRLPARSVIEVLPDGTEHRTGIWYGNLKARRDKLTEEQLAALRELEVH
ncbi:helicase associated domain-containing protein, partial [Streptomyces sp. NPDC057680]|uniref:helicase associated domain-containing protein n=1 Tax=Streptomyces sp. NPDC057680 TaxID=3346208 RepID=UPI0036775CBF